MRGSFFRRAALVAVLGSAVLVLGGGVGAVASAPRHLALHLHLGAKPRHHRLSTAQVRAGTKTVSQRVIVVLKNQLRAHPASAASVGTRIRLEARARRPLLAKVRSSGGSVTRQFRALNAFAATVSDAERARLLGDPAVASVLPDAVVRLPKPDAPRDFAGTASSLPAPNANPLSGICPTDPAKPLLEPEALQTTHTAFNDPATPQAQSLSTGKGVKVAFFADGLDIDNPDFIRPSGEHVFIDYQDFSGDGLNAPTGAAEAFGDASSIAAQGNQVYDIANFVNQAHPLPPGCNIKVKGMAPDAELIGMKVFGEASSAFNSTILEGLDYSVAVDHADILSESFGGITLPDSTDDLTRQFNEQAVASGVTVVESTGDSGAGASVESAASDPAVIAAGASTNFRGYAQTVSYGFQVGAATGWLSDNISSISTSGVDQGGHSLDLVAPGEVGWALCSPNVAIYEECTDFKSPVKAGSPLQQFGGTSESAPLIAGAAALVLQSYRDTHGGATPSPALVKQLLTSTSNDLGFPSEEQGAGELDSLKAVQAARSIHGGTPAGHSIVIDQTQLDLAGPAGSPAGDQPVAVTNTGTSPQTVSAHGRTIAATISDQHKTVNLGSSPTFVDQFGTSVPFTQTTFTVPAGTDRLVADDAWPGPNARVGLALVDPNGNYAAYTRPQGNGDHGEVDVHSPAPGTWKAIVFKRDGDFQGPVHLEFASQRYGGVDSVTPSSLTLAPGQRGTFHLHTAFPRSPGDYTHDLVVANSSGDQTVVPVVLRSLVNLDRRRGGTFDGTILGGNGRSTFKAQLDTFAFDVPAGEPELSVALTFADDAGTSLTGALVDPSGIARSLTNTTQSNADGSVTKLTHALQAYRVDPQPGRWHFVAMVDSPVGGNALQARYHGAISFRTPQVRTNDVPNSKRTVLRAGKPVKASIDVFNEGVSPQDVFVDSRLPNLTVKQLASLTDPTVKLPLLPTVVPPLFLMPTQSDDTAGFAQATEPVTFDFGFGDPDIAAISQGNNASAEFAAPELTPGVWFLAPGPIGPFNGPAPPGTAQTAMLAETRDFDDHAVASTGDIWREAVGLDDGAGFAPVNVAPGRRGRITVTFTPTGPKGTVVNGTLFVDNFSFFEFTGDEVVAVPYRYRIG